MMMMTFLDRTQYIYLEAPTIAAKVHVLFFRSGFFSCFTSGWGGFHGALSYCARQLYRAASFQCCDTREQWIEHHCCGGGLTCLGQSFWAFVRYDPCSSTSNMTSTAAASSSSSSSSRKSDEPRDWRRLTKRKAGIAENNKRLLYSTIRSVDCRFCWTVRCRLFCVWLYPFVMFWSDPLWVSTPKSSQKRRVERQTRTSTKNNRNCSGMWKPQFRITHGALSSSILVTHGFVFTLRSFVAHVCMYVCMYVCHHLYPTETKRRESIGYARRSRQGKKNERSRSLFKLMPTSSLQSPFGCFGGGMITTVSVNFTKLHSFT